MISSPVLTTSGGGEEKGGNRRERREERGEAIKVRRSGAEEKAGWPWAGGATRWATSGQPLDRQRHNGWPRRSRWAAAPGMGWLGFRAAALLVATQSLHAAA